jgi:tetratricopeptide (TPR) repeat protein
MSEPILLSLLVNIATSAVWDGVKYGAEGLLHQPPVSRAIDDTVSAFPDIEDLCSTLAGWCATDALCRLTERVQAGERHLTNDAVISSFIEVSGFYAGEETETLAQRIITKFFEKLEEALYASDQGLSIHATRQEILHQETRETVIRQLGQSMTPHFASLAEQQAQILQRLPLLPDDIENLPEVRERIFHAKVDEARELMHAGKSRSAKSQLLRLRTELADQSPSVELLFRIATNLGVCALDLSDVETARTELQLALQLRPHSPKALANTAWLALADGKPAEALEFSTRALEGQPQDPHVMSLYLEVLHRLGRTREIAHSTGFSGDVLSPARWS